MASMGELIGIYKARKARFIGLAVCGSVIIVVGLLLWLAAYAVSSGGITYRGSGNPVLLLAIGGAVLVGMGALFIYLSVIWRAKFNFELYENGIVIKQKKAEPISLLFTEIEDILTWTLVGINIGDVVNITHLAFRKNPSSEWFMIMPNTANHIELIEQFVALHTEKRGSFVFDQWQKTDIPMQIRYVDKSIIPNPHFAKNIAKILKAYDPFNTFMLAKDHIKIDNRIIHFDTTYKVEVGGWTDKIYLKDGSDEEKFVIHYPAVLSANIFVALLSAEIDSNVTE